MVSQRLELSEMRERLCFPGLLHSSQSSYLVVMVPMNEIRQNCKEIGRRLEPGGIILLGSHASGKPGKDLYEAAHA